MCLPPDVVSSRSLCAVVQDVELTGECTPHELSADARGFDHTLASRVALQASPASFDIASLASDADADSEHASSSDSLMSPIFTPPSTPGSLTSAEEPGIEEEDDAKSWILDDFHLLRSSSSDPKDTGSSSSVSSDHFPEDKPPVKKKRRRSPHCRVTHPSLQSSSPHRPTRS